MANMMSKNKKRKSGKRALAGFVDPKNIRQDISQNRRMPYLLTLLFYLLCAIILFPPKMDPRVVYQVGDVAPQSMRAPSDFAVVNQSATALLQKVALQKVPLTYAHDLGSDKKQLVRLRDVLGYAQRISVGSEIRSSALREQDAAADGPAVLVSPPKAPNIEAQIVQFELKYPGLLDKKNSYYLLKLAGIENRERLKEFKDNLIRVLNRLTATGIMADKDVFVEGVPKILELHRPGAIEPVELENIFSLAEAKGKARAIIGEIFYRDPSLNKLGGSLIDAILSPNLVFDQGLYFSRQELAANAVVPIKIVVKKGEIIVRDGSRINERQHLLLVALKTAERSLTIAAILGRLLIVAIIVFLLFFYLKRYCCDFYSADYLMIIYSGLLLVLLITQGFKYFGLFVFAAPMALVSMLTVSLLNDRVALMVTVVGSMLTMIMLNNNMMAQIYFLSSGLVGMYTVTNIRQRLGLVRAGFYVSMANVIIIMALFMLDSTIISYDNLKLASWGIVSGLLSAALTSTILPVYETLFGLTTDVKLLELSDLNLPLLRRLSKEAPGTYHHSIVVGNLAEAAADQVGANPLLVRVGAYYHDIGKISKAAYFSENNIIAHPHEKLKPNMSSLIVASHVKEGLELASRYKLPRAVVEIIQQHHGTSCISFFYQRALDEDEHNQVCQDDFRYPGPNPLTKEAAIVMLADAVEAASRTLRDVTVPNVRSLIKKIINGKLMDEQLSDCNLTFHEIKVIAGVFERVLVGILHPRVEYPNFNFNTPTKQNGKNNNANDHSDHKQSARGAGSRYPEDRRSSKEGYQI